MKNMIEIHHGRFQDIVPFLDRKFSMIFADLPYGTTRCKWDTPVDLDAMWPILREKSNKDTPMIFTAQTPFDKVLGCSNLKELRYEWIWEKTQATGHLNANEMPMKAHENILVFYRKLPTYNPQKTFGHERKVSTAHHKRGIKDCEGWGKQSAKVDYNSTERYPRSVQVFSSDKQKSALHRTQKPLALMEYLIKTYTNEGDWVLDPVMGSGTTGLACKNLGRNFVGIESDEDIFKVASRRLCET